MNTPAQFKEGRGDFIRKGEVGDWVNHFDEATNTQCDKQTIYLRKKKIAWNVFFFVPEGIYRLDMTKKRGNHS